MSQPSTPPRSIDLEEFERRLRDPQRAGEEADPLAELARLVGGSGRDPFAQVFADSHKTTSPEPARQMAPHLQPYAAGMMPAAPAPAPAPAPALAPSLAPSSPRPLPSSFAFSPRPAAPVAPPAPAADVSSPAIPSPRDLNVPPLPDFLKPQTPYYGASSASRPYAETASAYAPQENYLASFAQAAESAHTTHDVARDATYAAEAEGFYAGQNDGPWMPNDHYAPPPADFGYEEPRPRRKALWLASILIMVVSGIGAFFTFHSLSGPKEAPVISALTTPTKIQPETSDASDGATSASMLDRARTNDAQTQVINREEQPVDLAQAPLRPKAQTNSNGFPEPKKVRTVSVRPDGTIIDDPSAQTLPPPTPLRSSNAASSNPVNPAANKIGGAGTAPATPANDAKAATPKTPQRTATPPAAGDAKPKSIAQVLADSPPTQATTSAPTSSTASAPKSAPAPAVSGSFAVQFSSSPSEAEASASLARVKERFAGVLGAYRPTLAKGDANGHQVFRVRVNGLDRPKAVEICENIRAAGGTCFVAGN